MRLEGKVALITGGARGMGAAEARLFAREGAKVVIGDILEEEGKQVEAEVNEVGGEALFVKLDVTREEDWRKIAAAAVEKFGKLNVVVNNAGISGNRVALENEDAKDWDHVMDVNAKGVFLGMKHTIPRLREAGGGSIVNISSIAGILGSWQRNAAYGGSKAAVRIMTKNAALTYAKDNIRVNSIHPGVILTPMSSYKDPQSREEVSRAIPLGRLGEPDDVAYGALFLASNESSYITGSELVIDAGITAM